MVVDLAGNSRPIEEIEVGEFVLARSEFDPAGPLELKRVEEKFVRKAVVMELVVRPVNARALAASTTASNYAHGEQPTAFDLAFAEFDQVDGNDSDVSSQSIKTTAEHPFFVPARGAGGCGAFVPAGELQPGEQLVSHDGQLIEITSVNSTDEVTTVYNLRVADHHTYFVGGSAWGWDVWVHNANYAQARPSQGVLNNIHGSVFENVANSALSRTSRTPFFKSLRRGGFDDITLEGSRVVINEEKFVRRLQFDDFTSITTNLRSNVHEVLDSLHGSTRLSRTEKALVQHTLNEFLSGNTPNNLSIRILYGKAAPGSRLLKRIGDSSGLPIESVHIQGLDR